MGKAYQVCEYCWFTHFVARFNRKQEDGTFNHVVRLFYELQDVNRNKFAEHNEDILLSNTANKLTVNEQLTLVNDCKATIKQAIKVTKENMSGYVETV